MEAEIDGDWDRTNSHGCDLRRCLVRPPRKVTFSDYANDDLVDLWLVLEEVPETQDAYKIVYDPDFADDDPEFGGFGLAYGEYTKGADYIGVYGSFLSAYDGM